MGNLRNSGITMTDVATHAGVSQSTVSRVINNYPNINAETRDLVWESMRKLGYKNSANPGRESAKESGTIGLVMCPLPEQRNPFGLDFFNAIIAGINKGLEGCGINVALYTLESGAEEIGIPDEKLSELAGLIILNFPSEKLLAGLEEKQVRFVILNGIMPAFGKEYLNRYDVVECDHFGSHTAICRYLLDKGITRFGVFISQWYPTRIAAIEMELMHHGLTLDKNDIYQLENTDFSSFITATNDYIRKGNLPRAIVVGFHDAAEVVKSVLESNGIKVPEDVMIITVAHRQNQFPSIMEEPELQGFKAARRLVEKINNPAEPPHRILIPVKLVDNSKHK